MKIDQPAKLIDGGASGDDAGPSKDAGHPRPALLEPVLAATPATTRTSIGDGFVGPIVGREDHDHILSPAVFKCREHSLHTVVQRLHHRRVMPPPNIPIDRHIVCNDRPRIRTALGQDRAAHRFQIGDRRLQRVDRLSRNTISVLTEAAGFSGDQSTGIRHNLIQA